MSRFFVLMTLTSCIGNFGFLAARQLQFNGEWAISSPTLKTAHEHATLK